MSGPRAPGLRLHPRTMMVQRAEAELAMVLIQFQEAAGLTDAEMLTILGQRIQSHARFILRAERHPEDPSRKADEE